MECAYGRWKFYHAKLRQAQRLYRIKASKKVFMDKKRAKQYRELIVKERKTLSEKKRENERGNKEEKEIEKERKMDSLAPITLTNGMIGNKCYGDDSRQCLCKEEH